MNYLDSNPFPSHILNGPLLSEILAAKRIEAIRRAIETPDDHAGELEPAIKYMVPWSDDSVIETNSVDVILSHSVLEHVRDLDKTYRVLYSWLRPKGMMSHQIDFESHGFSQKWNGYRKYSELLWKIMNGETLLSDE